MKKLLGSKQNIHEFITASLTTGDEYTFAKLVDIILTPTNEDDERKRLSLIPKLADIIQHGEIGQEIKLEKPIGGILSVIPIYKQIEMTKSKRLVFS